MTSPRRPAVNVAIAPSSGTGVLVVSRMASIRHLLSSDALGHANVFLWPAIPGASATCPGWPKVELTTAMDSQRLLDYSNNRPKGNDLRFSKPRQGLIELR